MPSLEFSKKDLESLARVKFKTQKELEDALWLAKTELESIEGDLIKAALADSNRPDLLSVEGIAREIRHRRGIEKGIPKYDFKPSGRTAVIDPALKDIRPLGAFAFAFNVHVTEELLVQLVQFQEKICLTYGRRRKEVSMGIYDADQIHGTVYFKAAERTTKFIPLERNTEMTLDEILAEHPKGKEYANLLQGAKKYPLLTDEKNNVLSMPPVINSAQSGKVVPGKRNLFLDVTGFDHEKTNAALAMLCMNLADRGADVRTVRVQTGTKKNHSPQMSTAKTAFSKKWAHTRLGFTLADRQWNQLLQGSGFDAKIAGDKINVEYPGWRTDILHPVDLIEDVLIGYGYENIKPVPVQLNTVGHENALSQTIERLVQTCTGLGLVHTLTYYLTSPERQQTQMKRTEPRLVEIANPQSQNASVFRDQLVPGLLEVLARNTNQPFPQGIFEAGTVVVPEPASPTGVREPLHIAIAFSGPGADFNRAKGFAQELSIAFGFKLKAGPEKKPFLKTGKQARVEFGPHNGFVGELDADVMKNFGLSTPVCVVEIEWNTN